MDTALTIEELTGELKVLTPGLTAAQAADRVTDPAASFAVRQALTGGALPENKATITALRSACAELASA